MIWTVYAALAVGFLAVAGGLAFLAVRVLEAWRAFKRLRRHLVRELDRLAELGERTADSAAGATDTAELQAALGRLRGSLGRFAVIRAALDEATGAFGRFAAVYPRK